MPRTFSTQTQVNDPDMHHGACVAHAPWCMPGSLTSGCLECWWPRHSRRMRNAQFYVSGKRSIGLWPDGEMWQILTMLLRGDAVLNHQFVCFLVTLWFEADFPPLSGNFLLLHTTTEDNPGRRGNRTPRICTSRPGRFRDVPVGAPRAALNIIFQGWFDGSVLYCGISSALVMETAPTCAKSWIFFCSVQDGGTPKYASNGDTTILRWSLDSLANCNQALQ